jgi:hypothetical protein
VRGRIKDEKLKDEIWGSAGAEDVEKVCAKVGLRVSLRPMLRKLLQEAEKPFLATPKDEIEIETAFMRLGTPRSMFGIRWWLQIVNHKS